MAHPLMSGAAHLERRHGLVGGTGLRRLAASALSLAVLLTLLASFWVARLTGVTDGGAPYGFRATAFAVLALASCVAHAVATGGAGFAARFFLIAAAVSLAAELAGVTTGAVFGRYAYAAAFPAKLLGLLPLVVPLIWCAMSYLAFATAGVLLRGSRGGTLARAALAAALLLGYDVVADPNHVFRGGWSYAGGGAFYGVPLQNFAAWLVIGLAMFALLVRLQPEAVAGGAEGWAPAAVMPLGYLVILAHESAFALAVADAPAAGVIGLALAAGCILALAMQSAAVRDLWRSVRPAEVTLVTAVPIAGFLLATGPPGLAQAPGLVLCFCAGFCVAASAFVFNSREDLPGDRLNERLAGNVVVAGKVSEAALRFLMLALATAGVAAFALLGAASACMAATVLVCGYLYSSRRVRGKERPGVASLLHFASALAFFSAGAGLPAATAISLVGAAAIALLYMTGHFHHEIADCDADRAAGVRTLAVRRGPRLALLLGTCGFALFYALVALAWCRRWWPAPLAAPFLAGAPLHAAALLAVLARPRWEGAIATYRRFYRALFLAMAVAAGVIWWLSAGR